ncbi:hypothetical protein ATANTOWER_019435 [Ataeniobius toweri]|uniref:Secreted protein n=1 Tax=Ataeniobius toweri TaxID=208326 RepID=A0ABU7A8L0_9TELE|nr:hypothetical protein [Ataeniobius toweri]
MPHYVCGNQPIAGALKLISLCFFVFFAPPHTFPVSTYPTRSTQELHRNQSWFDRTRRQNVTSSVREGTGKDEHLIG